MSQTVNSHQSVSDDALRPDIGKLGLLFVSCGSIIGSSWLFAPMTSLQLAGPASIVSWLIGIILVLLIAITLAELSAMFPVAGGVARFPQFAFGSFASFTMGWITWLSLAAIPPIEVLATLQYAADYIPGLFEHNNGTVVLTAPGLAVSGLLHDQVTVISHAA